MRPALLCTEKATPLPSLRTDHVFQVGIEGVGHCLVFQVVVWGVGYCLVFQVVVWGVGYCLVFQVVVWGVECSIGVWDHW
jgi:hypothetical protein